MAIKSIRIGNFKGIADPVTLGIKPITLFIGENSSGKSTVLHALAALSQTIGLPNDQRALILDDEFAYVHLGRFIDVIHSRRYADSLVLGANVGVHQIRQRKADSDELEAIEGEVEFAFEFKSTKRTQGIFVTSGEVRAGENLFRIRRTSGKMSVENVARNITARWPAETGVILRERPLTSRRSSLDFLAFTYAQRAILKALRETLYLGPFRQSPRRSYPTRGASPS